MDSTHLMEPNWRIYIDTHICIYSRKESKQAKLCFHYEKLFEIMNEILFLYFFSGYPFHK